MITKSPIGASFVHPDRTWALSVLKTNRTSENNGKGWPLWHWVVRLGDERLGSGDDLEGHGKPPELLRALISLLVRDAELYARFKGPAPLANAGYALGEAVARWAYGKGIELEKAALAVVEA